MTTLEQSTGDDMRDWAIEQDISMLPLDMREILYAVRDMTPKQRQDNFEPLVAAAEYLNQAIKECQ